MFKNIDWFGLLKAIARAALPFFSGAVGGLFTGGCSIYGSGIGATM